LRFAIIVLLQSARDIVCQTDVKSAFKVSKNVNAISHRDLEEKWLRGLDLKQRSGSCRIMSRVDADP